MAFDLEEYLRTAFRDKLRLQTVPVWDGAVLLPSTRLLLKRQEVAEVERVLQSQREEFRQRMERLEQRRQQLGQRKDQLRDVVLKFNVFLKAAAARQERALRRVEEERARAAGQGAEAARLRQELTGLLQRREHLARRLRGFSDYLQGVLARTEQFQDVPAMLARFGVLAGARAALAQQAEAGQERLAQGWARLRRYQEETSSELLRTNNELTQLRACLEAARHEVLQGVRGDVGCPRSPPRERGSSMDPKRAAERRCPTRWWWEAGRHPLGWAGGPHVPRKHHQQLCMGGTQPGLPGPPVPAGGVQGTQGSGWGGRPGLSVTLSPRSPAGPMSRARPPRRPCCWGRSSWQC
ncbi:cilia- and flagella-associated protein 73 isoform 1-T1 [Spheniscus humboldti]